MEARQQEQRDWVSSYRSYVVAWGLPTAALLGAIFIVPPAKTLILAVALVWMGTACLANAVRCGRVHCYFTGPFFLLMAVAVLLHGIEVVWLGPSGWTWLGVTIAVGAGGLWILTERVWGKFARY